MKSTFNNIYPVLLQFDWSNVFQSIAVIWTACIATYALHTWKRQSKANLKIRFLDELTESIHEFILQSDPSIQMLQFVRIGMESYTLGSESDEITREGVIEYINKRGKEDSQRLFEHLSKCNNSISRINSLSAKGQIFNLINYTKCTEACKNLTALYNQIQAIASIINGESTNWENELANNVLQKLMVFDHKKIYEQIGLQNVKYLEFVKDNFKHIYK